MTIDQMQLFSPPKISTTRGHCKKVLNNPAIVFLSAKSFLQRVKQLEPSTRHHSRGSISEHL